MIARPSLLYQEKGIEFRATENVSGLTKNNPNVKNEEEKKNQKKRVLPNPHSQRKDKRITIKRIG